jgi:photosystem II stability/assembly factor-like uncharacterized protein
VQGVNGLRANSGGQLSLHGVAGYLIGVAPSGLSPGLWVTIDGVSWTWRPGPCSSGAFPLVSVAAIDATRAVFLCSGNGAAGSTTKQLFTSSDTGRTFHRLPADAPLGGDGGVLSAAGGTTFGLASSSAASFVYLTADGGRTWTQPLEVPDGGVGFGDFGFTDTTDGFVIDAPVLRFQQLPDQITTGFPAPGTLYLTNDAGRSWTTTAFDH